MPEDNIRAAAQIVMIPSQPIEGNKLFGKQSPKSKKGQNGDRKRSYDQSQNKRDPCNLPP